MFEQLGDALARFDEITEKLADPAVLADSGRFTALMREHKSLQKLAETYRAYQKACKAQQDALELLEQKPERELKELAEEELAGARGEQGRLAEELNVLLLPHDPNDEKNVILEIRGGAGGEEAALFAADLTRMYTMYAQKRGWSIEPLNLNETELGGVKEISFLVEGEGAFSRLKYESGVHRVQRVPATEAGGRIHTSTVTVAVLPEVEEVEVEIRPEDLQIDTYRASGAGGQHINKTDSAIRITHKPTGIVVECQDERSQYKNRDKAMKVLRSRLYERMQGEQDRQIAAERRSQVGTGERNERIRTYNFPQGRVTDHRIGLTLYKIDAVMNGELDELVEALITADRAQRLRTGEA